MEIKGPTNLNSFPLKTNRFGGALSDKLVRPPQADNALKFWNSELRKELCRNYCEHIAAGYSNDSFRGIIEKKRVDGKMKTEVLIPCTYKTVQSYIKNYPSDFPTDFIQSAEAERLFFWETMGVTGTAGQLKGFNSRSWEFNMQNRFKWRIRNDVTTGDEKLEPNIIYLPREQGDNAKE